MSEPIKAGDLCMVVKWPCCGLNLGKIGVVSNIDYVRDTYCVCCGAQAFSMPNADFPETREFSLACAPVAWLKRIDPPALSADTPAEAELEAR